MPRILSLTQPQRRGATGLSSSSSSQGSTSTLSSFSSHGMSDDGPLMTIGEIAQNLGETPNFTPGNIKPSSPSSNSSFPRMMRNQRMSSFDSFIQKEEQGLTDQQRTSTMPTTTDYEDSWGHFVDVAAADEEITRHSRILSSRPSYPSF